MTEDAEIYTYDFLTAQPDMTVVQLPQMETIRSSNGRVDTAKVLTEGMKNARSVGTERHGKVFVQNRYTGKHMWIGSSSIRHGLNGEMNRLLTNARLCAVIGDVVQNAIPINALHNKAKDAVATYAMAGYAQDTNGREFVVVVTVEQRENAIIGVDTYDVVHSVSGRQKRSSQADYISSPQGFYPSMSASEISIADFLSAVNSTYQSILPEDVLENLEETRNPDGYYSGRVRYSIDDEYSDYNTKYEALAETIRYTGQKNDKAYAEAIARGDLTTAQRMVERAANAAGYTIRAYHGTSRGDRVGNVFLPERATSGPMAFFTSDRNIAEHYAHDKADTSLDYDEEYTDYYTQFRVNQNGKSIKVQDLWRSLSFAERARLKEAGKHITWDEDMEKPVWNDDATYGLGNWNAYTLNQHRGNAIEALIDCWLESGELYGNEGDFIKVLELAGITGVEYRDQNAKHERVYDVYLKIQNPFDTSAVSDEFVDGFEEWYGNQPSGKYDRDTAAADMWDKNSQTTEMFAKRLRDDIADGTAYAWTSIPDSMTDYLKSLGHDGIRDKGGKYSGESHIVYIPFTGEQVKETAAVTYDDNGNVIPLSERFNQKKTDIRYSVDDSNDMRGEDTTVGGKLRQVAKIMPRGHRINIEEREYRAKQMGYPVIDDVQIVPYVTWVHATDPYNPNDPDSKLRSNYGQVIGRVRDGLVVAFVNKHEQRTDREGNPIEGEEGKKRSDRVIRTKYLHPVQGVYQMTADEEAALMASDPGEQEGPYEATQAELDELYGRASQSELAEAGTVPWVQLRRESMPVKAEKAARRNATERWRAATEKTMRGSTPSVSFIPLRTLKNNLLSDKDTITISLCDRSTGSHPSLFFFPNL